MDAGQIDRTAICVGSVRAALAVCLLAFSVSASATNLLGLEVGTGEASQAITQFNADGQRVVAAYERGTVLLGHAVPGLLLIVDTENDKAVVSTRETILDLPGVAHPIPGVDQQPLGTQAYTEYTLVALRIAPGISFEQCEAQMAKVLKLAKRYGAQPLETWRVVGKAKGLPDADLFGLFGWTSGASALRFALKLKSEGKGIRPAHDLNDENALVVQVRPL
jgi:hypothetical protein